MIVEIFIWWFILEIFGLLSFPMVMSFCRNLEDMGYAISKIFGLLLFSYLTWILSYVLNYDRFTIFLSILTMIFLSLFFVKSKKKKILTFLNEKRKTVILIEIVFFLSFLYFSLIRAHTPEVEGLEKFYDFSIINGILRSEKMPPLDPWLSGNTINYYYFGHFMVSTLTKLSGIPSYKAFNLGLATIFSLLSVGCFGLGYNLTKKHGFGIVSIFLLVLMSNLVGFLQVLTFIFPGLTGHMIRWFNLEYPLTCCTNQNAPFFEKLSTLPVWPSTRVIPNTINEFPYSDFLFGEVHAHALSMPFQILVLTLTFNLFSFRGKFSNDSIIEKLTALLILGISLGSLYLINSWELPTYFGIFAVSVLSTKFNSRKINIRMLIKPLLVITLIGMLSIMFYTPFYLVRKKIPQIGLVKEKTNIFNFIVLFPVFLFIIFSFLFLESKRDLFIFSLVSSFLLFIFFNIPLLVILVPIIVLSIILLFNKKYKSRASTEIRFVFILLIFSSSIALFNEMVFIDSHYNSVFKFYYHIWILWAVSSTYLVWYIVKNHKRPLKRFMIIFMFLCLACSIMSVFSTIHRISIGMSNAVTLDGWRYMRIHHPSDYATINWIIQNVKETSVILEAPGDSFTYSSIISSNTGFPTVVGWVMHEGVYRGMWPTERVEDVNRIYSTTDNNETIKLLEKYQVKYVFVGSVERRKYPESGLDKFFVEGMYRNVFDDGTNYLFEVKLK